MPEELEQTKKWWQIDQLEAPEGPQGKAGEPCPKCWLADLEHDSLFRIHCPICGYIAECGAFT
jgi:hypothetical protein